MNLNADKCYREELQALEVLKYVNAQKRTMKTTYMQTEVTHVQYDTTSRRAQKQ